MSRSIGSTSSTVSSRSFPRTVVPIRPNTKTAKGKVPRKPCENAHGNGMNLCVRTLSARSKFTKCDYCRRADKKWKTASAKDVVYWHRAYSLRTFRIAPYLPDDVATVKKRA
jgi:hypothetical protein